MSYAKRGVGKVEKVMHKQGVHAGGQGQPPSPTVGKWAMRCSTVSASGALMRMRLRKPVTGSIPLTPKRPWQRHQQR